MAILISDNFTRADDPASLGTATTGQTWSQAVADPTQSLGVVSNQAKFNAPTFVANISGQGWIDALTENAIVKVTLANVESLPGSLAYVGVSARREDASRMYRLVFRRLTVSEWFFTLEVSLSSGVFNTISSQEITPQNGDTIALALCGVAWIIYHNDVEIDSGDTAFFDVHGTAFGFITAIGPIGTTYTQLFDDFLVETDPACPISTAAWDLPLLEWAATGTVESLVPKGGILTKRFDAGDGQPYYLVAPLVDSGSELRSKVITALHQTGKRTNVNAKVYTYDVGDEIDVNDLENGTNSITGAIPLDDSTQVAQSEREQVNCPNAVLSTVRVEGDDTGEATRDRIDEIVVESAIQGVRR